MKWTRNHMWIAVAMLAAAIIGYIFLLPAADVDTVAEASNG